MKTIRIQFSELGDSYTPIIDYCRELIEKGIPVDTKLKIYRENDEPDVIVRNIGDAAKLKVSDCYFKVDWEYVYKIADKPGCSPVH